MKASILAVVLAAALAAVSGCGGSAMPANTRIQVDLPDEPYPGTRTYLLSSEVAKDRDVFEEFYRTTRQVGTCSPAELRDRYRAKEVLCMYFVTLDDADGKTFTILRDEKGRWLRVGYGGEEIDEGTKQFQEWQYSRRSLKRLRDWYRGYVTDNKDRLKD